MQPNVLLSRTGLLQPLRRLGPPLQALEPVDQVIVQEQLRPEADLQGPPRRVSARAGSSASAPWQRTRQGPRAGEAEQVPAGAAPERW